MSETQNHCCHHHPKKIDFLFIGSTVGILVGYFGYLFSPFLEYPGKIYAFFHAIFELVNMMSFGIVFGLVFIGLLSFVPREVVLSIIGSPKSKRGIVKATLAGVLLDMCNHGIVMIAVKLYERGASLAQVIAFLIASPWNSFSLTLILMSLIGLPLTAGFVLLSAGIAILTGFIVRYLLLLGKLPANPNAIELPESYDTWAGLKSAFAGKFTSAAFYGQVIKLGIKDGKMVLKWIFFGTLLTAAIRLFLTPEQFQLFLGPSLGGLGLTLFVATVLEVCSEGSSPIAADLVNRAGAPGNAFAFLMTGVSTDYTEIMSIKDATNSWRSAFVLPLLTLPQVLALSILLNGL